MHNCYCKHERFFKQMMGVFVRAVLAVTQNVHGINFNTN